MKAQTRRLKAARRRSRNRKLGIEDIKEAQDTNTTTGRQQKGFADEEHLTRWKELTLTACSFSSLSIIVDHHQASSSASAFQQTNETLADIRRAPGGKDAEEAQETDKKEDPDDGR
jgi:hypothetical protein